MNYNTALHSTAQHSTAQHSTAQHSTAQHCTVLLVYCTVAVLLHYVMCIVLFIVYHRS